MCLYIDMITRVYETRAGTDWFCQENGGGGGGRGGVVVVVVGGGGGGGGRGGGGMHCLHYALSGFTLLCFE